jgi:hypothetical protein
MPAGSQRQVPAQQNKPKTPVQKANANRDKRRKKNDREAASAARDPAQSSDSGGHSPRDIDMDTTEARPGPVEVAAIAVPASPPPTELPPGGSATPDASSQPDHPPSMEEIMTKLTRQLALDLNFRLSSIESTMAAGFQSVGGEIQSLNARVGTLETDTSARFDQATTRIQNIETSLTAKLQEFETKLAAAPVAASDAAAAASSSSGYASAPRWSPPAARPGAPAPEPSRIDEKCIVLIRKFPEKLSRSVLMETFEELRGLMPERDRESLRAQISAVDSQIKIVFPTPTMASSFMDYFHEADFFWRDPDTFEEHTLTAQKGRPLAIRRRGGAIHPVYAKAEILLRAPGPLQYARLVPHHSTRNGVSQSEYFAETGRKVTSLFTIFFEERTNETVITDVTFSAPRAFSDEECRAIRTSAGLQ